MARVCAKRGVETRIIFLAHQSDDGGIGTFVRGLASAFGRVQSADARVVATPAVGSGRAASLASRPGMSRLLYEQLFCAAATRRATLVHNPDHRGILLRTSATVITVHDLFFFDDRSWMPQAKRAYKQALLRATIAKRPDGVVCVSDYTREVLLSRFATLDPARVQTIRPGVDIPKGSAHNGDTQSDYFLTVSTLEPRKNHVGLLRAFERARRKGFRLRWKVVGGLGWAGSAIAQQLAAVEGVDVIGRVTSGALDDLYARARFVASPSFAEGFGYPPFEAMARGIACICSTGSAYDEIAEDAAMRCPADDPESWSEALCELEANDDLRVRLTQAGTREVGRYTWERAAASHLSFYERILA